MTDIPNRNPPGRVFGGISFVVIERSATPSPLEQRSTVDPQSIHEHQLRERSRIPAQHTLPACQPRVTLRDTSAIPRREPEKRQTSPCGAGIRIKGTHSAPMMGQVLTRFVCGARVGKGVQWFSFLWRLAMHRIKDQKSVE
jgi:hypothetical protein